MPSTNLKKNEENILDNQRKKRNKKKQKAESVLSFPEPMIVY